MRAAPGELQPLVVDTFARSDRKAWPQRHAAAQALRKVDVAAHRTGRDRGDLGLDALHVSDFVDAFDRDERGIHVQRNQPHLFEPAIAE
jgi:hypothetical protein